jgi:hypothetical protein
MRVQMRDRCFYFLKRAHCITDCNRSSRDAHIQGLAGIVWPLIRRRPDSVATSDL